MKPFLLGILCSIFTLNTFAQVSGNYNKAKGNESYGNYGNSNAGNYYNPSVISLKGVTPLNDSTFLLSTQVMYNIKADKLVAIFSLTQMGKDLKECNNNANARLTMFKNKLNELGISAENIHTDMIYCIPKFDMVVEKKVLSRTATEVPNGFELQKNMHITFNEEAQLEGIINAAFESEIYEFVKVDYFMLDKYKWQNTAFLKAISLLDAKADTLVKRFNVPVKTRNVVAEDMIVVSPPEKYKSYSAYETNMQTGKGVKPRNTTYAEKPITQFYEALPQDEYEYIENPIENKPYISLIYGVTVRITIPKEKTMIKEVKEIKEVKDIKP